MENKYLIIVFFLAILIGCNNHPKKDAPCSLENVMCGNVLGFIGFKNFKFNKIEFKKLDKSTVKIYENQTLERAISTGVDFETRLHINDTLVNLLQKDCFIIINNKLKFKISDVNTGNIERYGNWGSVGYQCILDQYKLNDSLITNQQYIKIFN